MIFWLTVCLVQNLITMLGSCLHCTGGDPPKVIVFSQFWMHLKLVEQQLGRHGIQFLTLKGGESFLCSCI